jgi:hypothetical protein
MNMKKLGMPIFMAAVGIFAVVAVALSLGASAPVTLKSITLSDQSAIWVQPVKVGDKITIPTGMAKVYVKAVATDPAAKVTVVGDTDFKDGNNTLAITVTGSDHKSSKTYNVTLVQVKLVGWCVPNKAKVSATNDNYELADIYQDYSLIFIEPGATEAEVRANLECFSANLQKYMATH